MALMRIKGIRLNYVVLDQFLKDGPQEYILDSGDRIPRDATLLEVRIEQKTRSVVVLFEHESFDEYPWGCEYPVETVLFSCSFAGMVKD